MSRARLLVVIAVLAAIPLGAVSLRAVRRARHAQRIREIEAQEPWDPRVHPVTWADFDRQVAASKGHATLVVIWAAWCGDCRQELPELTVALRELSPRGLAFVPLSIDETPTAMNALLARTDPPAFDLARIDPVEPTEIARAVQKLGGNYTGSIPYTMLLSKDGALVREWRGRAVSKAELVVAAGPLL